MSELAIVEIEQSKALDLFTADKGLDPHLEKIAKEARSFVPDITTVKGRKDIASIAHKVAKSKTAIDAVGKDLVSKLKEQPKLVDSERKRVRDFLDALKDEVRKPLTDWENEEKFRVDSIKLRISEIEINDESQYQTSEQAKLHVDYISSLEIDDSYQEFKDEAQSAKDSCLVQINSIYDRLIESENKQKEIERLEKEKAAIEQKDREERIAREAAQKAKREAEQEALNKQREIERRANEEREAAERRELELKLEKERAEREKLEAQREAEQAQKRAEQEVIDKRNAEIEEEKAREADLKHRKKINNEALEGLMLFGANEDLGKAIIKAIAKGQVKNVVIKY